MIVTLPMYDRPELRADTDALWTAIRANLGYGPLVPDRKIGLIEGWTAPGLLLSQTCNLPYHDFLSSHVHLLGSPDLRLPGCQPGYYNSVLVTHSNTPGTFEDLVHKRVVINQTHSHSGCRSLLNHAAQRGLKPKYITESGAHIVSARMIAAGHADLAALDCHSWRLIRRFDPYATQLRELGFTDPSPAPPYITSRNQDPDALRHALGTAIRELTSKQQSSLGLFDLIDVPENCYRTIPFPAEAVKISA